MITTRIASISALVLCAIGTSHAAEPELYLGRGTHLRVELGMGYAGDSDLSILSLTPTVEGRFAIARNLGIQAVLPTLYVNAWTDDDGDDDFAIGNPSAAFEVLFDDRPTHVTLARFGLTLPLLSVPSAQLGRAFARIFNVALAAGSRGGLDLWRYAPETFSLFAEVQGSHAFDELFVEFRGGLGALIGTDEDSETELVIQALGRLGYGAGAVRPFIGVTMLVVPTEYRSAADQDNDVFQLGVQLGLIAQLGSSRLDFHLHLNIDEPMGFSFDDDGIFGAQVAVTVPF